MRKQLRCVVNVDDVIAGRVQDEQGFAQIAQIGLHIRRHDISNELALYLDTVPQHLHLGATVTLDVGATIAEMCQDMFRI